MPWHYPDDLKHFKQTTLGSPLIMGRKTFESIGGKPLPGRPCYVLSRSKRKAEGVTFFKDFPEALLYFSQSSYERVFIAGGSVLYNQFLIMSNKMIITEIRQTYDGDTFFPEYRDQIPEKWKLISSEDRDDFVIKTYQNTQPEPYY